MSKPMREWNELYPKEVELFTEVVNQRDAAQDEVERLRGCLAMFATRNRWRQIDTTDSDAWCIKVWAWSTLDVPWQTAQEMLGEEEEKESE